MSNRRRKEQQQEYPRMQAPPGSSLGDLSPAESVPVLDVTFGWFGAQLRVNPELSELSALDFAERAMTVDEDSPEAFVMVKDQFRAYVHQDDFAEFWSLTQKNRLGLGDLLEFMKRLVGGLTERPTMQPSVSSDGPPSMPENSKDDSSTRVIRQMEEQGRPDLAWVYEMAREGRQAASV